MQEKEFEQMFEQLKSLPSQERLAQLLKLSKEDPKAIDALWKKVQEQP